MKQNIFDELKQSMKEAVQIARGDSPSSRTFTVWLQDLARWSPGVRGRNRLSGERQFP